MRRRASLLVLVLVLAGLAAGCGGDDGDSSEAADPVEPATWASGFCEAFKTFSTGISEAGSDLAGDGLPSGDEIVQAIDNAGQAATAFADDLRELGRPDVPSGEEIASTLETAAEDASKTFEDAKDEVGEVDNVTDVAVAAGNIAEATQAALATFGAALERVQELDVESTLTEALESTSECVGLGD